MKRALFLVLAVAIVLMVIAPFATTASADGPWGYGNHYGNGYGNSYGYGYVYPGSGYNKVCMYSSYNCSYRFVPPYPVSGYYQYPYNTYYQKYTPYYNPSWCTPGLYC